MVDIVFVSSPKHLKGMEFLGFYMPNEIEESIAGMPGDSILFIAAKSPDSNTVSVYARYPDILFDEGHIIATTPVPKTEFFESCAKTTYFAKDFCDIIGITLEELKSFVDPYLDKIKEETRLLREKREHEGYLRAKTIVSEYEEKQKKK